ncbi:MAG: S8 family peptidase [Deinococcus sp.]|uniref:S8 family peptidase n=1 Tax=Deinococcus sp. TaxID=47478 RepID=UPI0026DB7F27|nr:S8 family peptidase [Deinococcus sp.]MDO4246234.1 S8 family peptidase [Deinococcus sp.]
MSARLFSGALTLTLILASCGTQPAQPQPNQSAADLPQPQVISPIRGHALAPVRGTDNRDAIAGQYIVVFSEGATTGSLSAQNVAGQALSSLSAPALIRALGLDPQGISVQNIYSQALQGFSGRLSAQNLQTLRADKRVKYIEQDQTMYATGTQSNPTWGIDRVDQRSLPLDKRYTYGSASNVKAYILDTGININHVDFGGRATWGTNTTGDGRNVDCDGHGTHVAGTVGSATWGVAKDVRLIAVKVLNCSGSGSNSGIIAGMDWVLGNGTGPKVVNMSLGPQTRSTSQAIDDAVAKLYNNNVTVVVAAGNSNDNASYYSPARAPQAITVGATTSTDARSSFSNYGTPLDIFAPGSSITSALNTNNTGTDVMSGTSMASPHVAGAVALILGANPSYSTSQVTSALLNNATTGKVTDTKGSVNRLLYTGAAGGTTTPPSTGTTTTYSGSVSSGASSYKPGSSGFSYSGGTLKATLSAASGTDFDLYLQKYNGSSWVDVAASESAGSSESINYAATSGTYRWEIYAYSGSGSYSLTETK